MAEPVLQAGANRLPVIASSINDHLAAAEQATKHGLEHAIAAGLLLLEAKDLVGHGAWITWLEANCRVGVRQAQTFMRLARNRHKLDALKCEATAYLTVTAAEALVGRPKPERPYGLLGQLDLLGGPEVVAPTSKPEPLPPKAGKATSPLGNPDQVHRLIRDLQRVRTAVIRDHFSRDHILMLGDAVTILKKHLAHVYSY
jgi:hypothetical protein